MRIRANNLSILYLLTLALLFNAIAPVFAYPGGDGLNPQSSSTKVLLCTSKGYQWVTLDEQTEQSQSSDASSTHCVLCISDDNSTDKELLAKIDFHQLFFTDEPPRLTNHYPLLQALFIEQLADVRAPPRFS